MTKYFFIFFSLSFGHSFGQAESIYLEKLDEFDDVFVSDICQDSKGFIWLGTQDGLIRYDGHDFNTLRYSPENKNTLPGNWIKTLSIVEDGTFYLGTQGGGLSELSLTDMTFENDSYSNMGMLIETLISLPDGAIALRSENGVFVISDNKEQNKIPFEGYVELLSNQQNHIWLGHNHKLILYDRVDGKKLLEFDFNARVLALIPILNNTYLVATEAGLFEFDANLRKKKRISEDLFFGGIAGEEMTILYSKHRIFQYHNATKSLIQQDLGADLSNSEINTLFKDRQDILWIGTDNGLYKEQKTAIAFRSQQSLDYHARRILKYKNHLFIGGKEGLHVVTEHNEKTQLIKGINIRSLDTINSKVWAGGQNGNFYVIDSQFNIEKRQLEPKIAEGLVIYGFKKDENQRVWVPTWRGFYVLDTLGNVIKRNVRLDHKVKMSYAYLDRNDRLWITTVDNGIYKIENLSNIEPESFQIKFEHYTFNSDDLASITSNIVIATEVDQTGKIWFGTDSGMVSYNESTNDFSRLQFSNTLFNEKIMCIKADAKNDLWITTINKGIFVYNRLENYWLHFKKTDGLISNSYLYTSGFFDARNNELFFGSDQGVQKISPDLVFYKPNIFEPQITEFNITTSNSDFDIHPFQAPYLDEIHLQYTQNDFVLHFSGLDFVNDEKLTYAYKLDNFAWKMSDVPYVYFTNTAYGAHQLQIKAMSSSDTENNSLSKLKTLKFKISPPWYRSWLAYLGYGIIFMSGAFFMTLLVVNKKIATEQMKNIATMDIIKSKMYANISHEIRTPVTTIYGLSELALKQSKDAENTNNLKGILKSSNQLLNLVNEMLELVSLDANKVGVNYKNGDVIAFISECVDLYRPLAHSNGQTLTFNTDSPQLKMDVDDNKLQKILNNLLSNALKFTPDNGQVTVSVTKAKDYLKIEVVDTGRGIKKEELPMVFDRYYKTFDKNENLGSGIGMALTKELVELLQGQIIVESEINKGTKFTIYLPIKNTVALSSEFTYEVPFVVKPSKKNIAVDNKDKITLKHSILVIEDSVEIRDYLEQLLGEIYQITAVENGLVAQDFVRKNEFDLIISDLQMPKMDGYTFCQSLKNDINSSHIPFVVLTARTETQDKIRGYDMGIDAYIIKPFDPEELLVIIKNLITKRVEQVAYFNKLLHLKSTVSENLNLNHLDVDLMKKLQEIILDKNQATSIEYLTQTLLISKSQLHRKVKALTGMSVSHYVNHIKIEKAKDLLKNTQLNINEIAYEVGYDDPTYFSRVFKKANEISPDQFRKQIQV